MKLVKYLVVILILTSQVESKVLPSKEEITSREEYRLIMDYRKKTCAFIDENTNYEIQNQCFHIVKKLYELTGNKDFLYGIAEHYFEGYGVTKNFKKGLKLFEEMANSDCDGSIYAQEVLGIHYGAKGSPVIDRAKEEYWVKRAADNGSALSQYYYARMLKNRGKLNDAIYWYKKAASNGSLMAKYKLAVFFNEGYSMQINRRKAYELLHEAAKEDFAPAFQELSFFYDEDGDCERAKFWHAKFTNSDFFKKVQSGVHPDDAISEILNEKKKQEYIAEVQKEMEEIEKKSSQKKQ